MTIDSPGAPIGNSKHLCSSVSQCIIAVSIGESSIIQAGQRIWAMAISRPSQAACASLGYIHAEMVTVLVLIFNGANTAICEALLPFANAAALLLARNPWEPHSGRRRHQHLHSHFGKSPFHKSGNAFPTKSKAMCFAIFCHLFHQRNATGLLVKTACS